MNYYHSDFILLIFNCEKYRFKAQKQKETYDKIQSKLFCFCNSNKISAPIALDLLWRDRYKQKGNDFFELTLAAIKK